MQKNWQRQLKKKSDLTPQHVWLFLTMLNCLDNVQLESAGGTRILR